jgi:hypothetical protein
MVTNQPREGLYPSSLGFQPQADAPGHRRLGLKAQARRVSLLRSEIQEAVF